LVSVDSFKKLRENLSIEMDKSKARDSIALFLEGENLLFIPPHSIKNDEWGTAELSWMLAKELGAYAIIPSRYWNETDESFIFQKLTDFDFNMIVELGGWKKDTIGILSNNLNIMQTIIYFIKRFYTVSPAKFHTLISRKYLYDNQLSYLRIEVPNNIRTSFKKSFELFKILHALFFKMRTLDFSPIINSIVSEEQFCFYCQLQQIVSNSLGLPLCFDCLSSVDLWKISLDISEGNYDNRLISRYERPFKRNKKKCLLCRRTFLTDLLVPVCNECIEIVDFRALLLSLGTRLMNIKEIEKRITKSSGKDQFDSVENNFMKINLKSYSCIHCGENLKHSELVLKRLRLCKKCHKKYDINRLLNNIRERRISFHDFIYSSGVRNTYLKSSSSNNPNSRERERSGSYYRDYTRIYSNLISSRSTSDDFVFTTPPEETR